MLPPSSYRSSIFHLQELGSVSVKKAFSLYAFQELSKIRVKIQSLSRFGALNISVNFSSVKPQPFFHFWQFLGCEKHVFVLWCFRRNTCLKTWVLLRTTFDFLRHFNGSINLEPVFMQTFPFRVSLLSVFVVFIFILSYNFFAFSS